MKQACAICWLTCAVWLSGCVCLCVACVICMPNAHLTAHVMQLNKPLACRVFPVPGKKAGELVTFDNPHLCDCTVFAVE